MLTEYGLPLWERRTQFIKAFIIQQTEKNGYAVILLTLPLTSIQEKECFLRGEVDVLIIL